MTSNRLLPYAVSHWMVSCRTLWVKDPPPSSMRYDAILVGKRNRPFPHRLFINTVSGRVGRPSTPQSAPLVTIYRLLPGVVEISRINDVITPFFAYFGTWPRHVTSFILKTRSSSSSPPRLLPPPFPTLLLCEEGNDFSWHTHTYRRLSHRRDRCRDLFSTSG